VWQSPSLQWCTDNWKSLVNIPRLLIHTTKFRFCTYHGYVFVGFLNSCLRQGGTRRPFLKFDIYPLRVNFDQSFGDVALCWLFTDVSKLWSAFLFMVKQWKLVTIYHLSRRRIQEVWNLQRHQRKNFKFRSLSSFIINLHVYCFDLIHCWIKFQCLC
jgi:hypothetical protein